MKEEYEELKRLNAIKANLPKVKNILEKKMESMYLLHILLSKAVFTEN